MKTGRACRHERDVVEAVMLGWWPSRVEDDLALHVDQCDGCREAVALATAFEAEMASAAAEAAGRLPDGRLVWWRAQIRARDEARRAAERPITAAGTLAAVAGISAAVGLTGLAGGLLGDWWDRAWAIGTGIGRTADAVSTEVFGGPATLGTLAVNHTVVVAVVSGLVLLPLLLYVALREH